MPTSTAADAGAKQTNDPGAAVPVPANVPTLNQPVATNPASPAPATQQGSDPQGQANSPAAQQNSPQQQGPVTPPTNNDPAKQQNSPSQPQPATPPTNNDPEGGNHAQQVSDPNNNSGNNNGGSGQQGVPQPNNNPNPVNNNQGPNQNGGEASQNNQQQIQEASPFQGYSKGQAMTINNIVAQPQSDGISIAGTTLTRGAEPITVAGTPIHYGSSALVVGASTVPLAPEVPTPVVNPVTGQGSNGPPNAAPGVQPAGGVLSLDDAGQLMYGAKTVPLAAASQGPIATNIGGQAISAAEPNGIIPIAGDYQKQPDASNDSVGKGTPVSLNTAGQLIVGSKTIPLPPNGKASSGLGGLIMGGFNTGGPSSPEDGGRGGGGGGGENPTPVVNTVNGQLITAGVPTALALTALTPGAPALTINGVAVSLNTASQLVVGSSTTIPLDNDGQSATTGSPSSPSSGQQTTAAAGSLTTTTGGSMGPLSEVTPDGSLLNSTTGSSPTSTSTTQSGAPPSITGGSEEGSATSKNGARPTSQGNTLSLRRRRVGFVKSWPDIMTGLAVVAMVLI